MILRVFPQRTSYTPTDDYVRIGEPDMLPLPPDITECHISCVFSWDAEYAAALRDVWQTQVPCAVRIGGPAFYTDAGSFEPGKYVKRGISISSRGCPNAREKGRRMEFARWPRYERLWRRATQASGTAARARSRETVGSGVSPPSLRAPKRSSSGGCRTSHSQYPTRTRRR